MEDVENTSSLSVAVGIILEITATVGLLVLAFVLICLIHFKYVIKDPPMLLVTNLLFCDFGHLILAIFYLGPSMFTTSDDEIVTVRIVSISTLFFWLSSLMHLTYISTSRLLAVCYPQLLKTIFTKKRAILMTTLTWLICVLIALIVIVNNVECCIEPFDFIDTISAERDEYEEKLDSLFISVQTVTGAVVLYTVYCYVRIGVKLWRVKNIAYNQETKKYRQLAIQFFGVSVLFLAHCLINFVSSLLPNVITLLVVSKFLYVLNSSLAPFIVFSTNGALKRETREFLAKICKRQQQNVVTVFALNDTVA